MTKTYAHIADAIEAHAATLPAEAKPLPKAEQTPYQAYNGRRLQRVHTVERTELTVDGITLRFPASKPAALAVAAKYRKGKTPPRSWTPPTLPKVTSRPFCATTLDDFIADCEYENAEQYAKLHGRELYFGLFGDRRVPLRKATVLKQDSRFVVHRVGKDSWRITHIASGKGATGLCRTSVEAVDAFDRIDRAKLEAAIAPYHDNGADRPAHAENAAATA